MLAILSDIHGNLPALNAVVEDALAHGCNRFLSLGDVAGYGAQPNECIDLLKRYNTVNVLGNHDSYLVFDTNCSRSEKVSNIISYHKKIVDDERISWLNKSLLLYCKDRVLYVHGGPDDYQEQYLYFISKEIIPDNVDILFSGHTHVQLLVKFGKKAYCNPGSVGQPRDGDARAAYAIMDNKEISLHRVCYDIDQAVFEIKKAGFESCYYENLYNGTQIGGRIDFIRVIKKGDL